MTKTRLYSSHAHIYEYNRPAFKLSHIADHARQKNTFRTATHNNPIITYLHHFRHADLRTRKNINNLQSKYYISFNNNLLFNYR